MIKTSASNPLFFRSKTHILPLQTDAMPLKTPINTGTFGRFSRQTGIQFIDCHEVLKDRVREHSPLKQGLRLEIPKVVATISSVREHSPLKQGLRHSGY